MSPLCARLEFITHTHTHTLSLSLSGCCKRPTFLASTSMREYAAAVPTFQANQPISFFIATLLKNREHAHLLHG